MDNILHILKICYNKKEKTNINKKKGSPISPHLPPLVPSPTLIPTGEELR